jgi:hypothetical protein
MRQRFSGLHCAEDGTRAQHVAGQSHDDQPNGNNHAHTLNRGDNVPHRNLPVCRRQLRVHQAWRHYQLPLPLDSTYQVMAWRCELPMPGICGVQCPQGQVLARLGRGEGHLSRVPASELPMLSLVVCANQPVCNTGSNEWSYGKWSLKHLEGLGPLAPVQFLTHAFACCSTPGQVHIDV